MKRKKSTAKIILFAVLFALFVALIVTSGVYIGHEAQNEYYPEWQ